MSSDPDQCCGNCKHCKTVAWWVSDDGEHRPYVWACTREIVIRIKESNESCDHYINKFILKVRKNENE